jgi:glutaredoxin
MTNQPTNESLNRTQRIDALARLLETTAAAHREAFAADDGVDPDWAIWYANHVRERGGELLPESLSRAALVKSFLELESEHAARGGDAAWPQFYAQTLVDRFVAEAGEQLQLYVSRGCGFCTRVLRVVAELGVEIETRDIYADRSAFSELVAARGRATVPVLRCTAGAVDRFMPESADIIRYLRARFG